MKSLQIVLQFACILLCPLVRADEIKATATQYTLKGKISDENGTPLAGVRVGLRMAGLATQTDHDGQFTLLTHAGPPLSKDKANAFEYLELDKDGYMGRTINIQEPAFFDHPLSEKLSLNPVTEDRAEFTARISMDHIFHGIGHDKEYSLITSEQWQTFFAGLNKMKKDGPTEQVVFQAYIPKDSKRLKAMMLITRHGMGSIDHPRLRDFANRNGVALISVKGNPMQRGFYPVSIIDEHIERLGRMLKHPELVTLPLISFGHSNGTGFAGIFPSQRRERVIAWISYHSGAAFHLQFPGVEKVPGLAMHGLIDPFFKNGQEQTVKNLRKERNAALAMMIEANVAHGAVDKDQNATWEFIIQFCEAAMRIRLNQDGTLKPVVIEQGWLGANYDANKGGQQELAVAPYAEFKGDRSIANWLPDRKFAEVWQLYGRTDPRSIK
jgi:hypothetical protein